MKIGMKEDMDIAVNVLKGKNWDENVHEGGHGRC